MKLTFNKEEVKKALELLKPDGEPFEIRTISKKGKKNIVYHGFFTDTEKVVDVLSKHNFPDNINTQIYFTLNSINRDFIPKNEYNGLFKGRTTNDENITAYKILLIDLDTKRETGTSSSSEELEKSHQKAVNVYQTLKEYGFGEPITALSGNGYHLLYKVNFENTPENAQLVKDFLETLSRLYSDNMVEIDTTVHNPARICKLYGTIAAKGTPTEERPHRQAKILTVPAELSETSRDLLQSFVNEHEQPKEKNTTMTLPQTYSGTSNFILSEWIAKNNVPISSTVTKGNDTYYYTECPWKSFHTTEDGEKDAAIIEKSSGEKCFKCLHSHCSDRHWRDFRSFYEPNAYKYDTSLAMSFFGKKTSNDIQTNENNNMQADEQEYEKIVEIAKKNVLDKAVFEFANRFNDLSDFDAFFNELLPFANFQRQKTAFKNEMKEKRKSIEDRERLEKRAKRQHGLPDWIYFDKNDTVKINETKYIEYFVESYPLKYTNGTFFDYFGKKKDGEILQVIHSDIKNYIVSNLARTANNLFNALKNAVYCNEFIPDMKQIHFRNGILSADKDGLFTIWESDRQEIYINNLSCTYNPNAKEPKKFLKFLENLLFDDDIITLHQWLGYLLLPTNKLQLSLYLQGSGGEGKSVIGNILKELFGIKNIFSGRIEDFDTNRFSTSELENKLFFLDDDVACGALKNSGKFKTIISNGGKFYVEKKGQQQHSVDLYSRFLIFGNYPLISLFDNSNGFYRRFHYIRVKPKAKNRNDILDIEHTFLDEEKEGIVKWLVDGLNELIKNNWKLYISERSKTVSDGLKFQSDTIRIFLDSGFDENSNIIFGANNRVPVAVLYDTYLDFCRENGLDTVSRNGFSNRIQSMQNEYNLQFSTNIPTCDKNGTCKRVRGFKGIGIRVISVPNTNYNNNTISE